MIEAPQPQEAWPRATEAPPNGPSKASMMIAAYRAARLNQRLTLRAAPLPQRDLIPFAELSPTAPESAPEDVVALAHPGLVIAEEKPPTSTPADAFIPLAEPASPARGKPALAEIGLGPSMLLRLNQIGVKSVHDVAQATPDDLRAALGSSSRLLNVEAWIASARHLTATG